MKHLRFAPLDDKVYLSRYGSPGLAWVLPAIDNLDHYDLGMLHEHQVLAQFPETTVTDSTAGNRLPSPQACLRASAPEVDIETWSAVVILLIRKQNRACHVPALSVDFPLRTAARRPFRRRRFRR